MDAEGDFCWHATKTEMSLFDEEQKARKVGLAAIEKMAVQGKDVNDYFTKGKVMPPLKSVQRVNVDFTAQMLNELDKLAQELNISRQAVIKSFLRVALDQHLSASKKSRSASSSLKG
jgi:hypothetical protein